MIDVENLHVRYPDGTVAIEHLSLTLADGEFAAVVGPSGCGKSTLLRVVAGLVPATMGSVSTGNTNIGFVFQEHTLLPWRSLQRNVELGAELTGVGRAERRKLAREAIERVGLSGFENARPAALSGGMRMRGALARTLVARPELLLCDEPFGSVDEITRTRLCDDLQELYAADKFSALFVTHSLAEAVYLASRVIVMSDRPGTLAGEITVPFEYPRPPEIRYTPEFAELTAQAHALLQPHPAKASA
jgi:NitT/TauT family transport system ATP-binding protein